MTAYRGASPHRDAMPKLQHWCDGAADLVSFGGRGELRMDVPGSKYVAGFVAEHNEAALVSQTRILEVSNHEQPT
jgi:hypothetical protein